MVKEPRVELKFTIFKNWLDTHPKMETHEPRVYPTILGGVSQGFWSPLALENGHTDIQIYRHTDISPSLSRLWKFLQAKLN